MHELSVCQALMDQVNRIALDHQAVRVDEVVVEIGPLSGVVPDLLQQAWTVARAGSVAEHADLTLEESLIKVRCLVCGAETEAKANKLVCGECGAWQTQLLSGEELMLKHLELTKDTEPLA